MQADWSWFSEGSAMRVSSTLRETREFWRRVSSEASWSSGAMMRPTRMLQPMSPPMLISPSPMR